MIPDATAAMAQALDALDEQARQAKRRAAQERRRARDLRQLHEELRRACSLAGLSLVVTQTHSPRRHSG